MDNLRRKLVDQFIANMSKYRSGDDQNLTSYADSSFAQYWMPDVVSTECYECGMKFSTFKRRHHCRICGQIFCSKCCCNYISGRTLQVQGN